MPKYQIVIAVDVDAADEDHAQEIAANLETFLGMHHETSTLGCVTEIIELDAEDPEEDYLNLPDEDLVDEYDPMQDVNYVGHPIHY
jgi:hypothetical protein